MKKRGWLEMVLIGLALFLGSVGVSKANVKCPGGASPSECGIVSDYYCQCGLGGPQIYAGRDCWCGRDRECYPCQPPPNCQLLCEMLDGKGFLVFPIVIPVE